MSNLSSHNFSSQWNFYFLKLIQQQKIKFKSVKMWRETWRLLKYHQHPRDFIEYIQFISNIHEHLLDK